MEKWFRIRKSPGFNVIYGEFFFLYVCECIEQNNENYFRFHVMKFLFYSFAEGGQGSWESGITYECRSLLFKALHNLIER